MQIYHAIQAFIVAIGGGFKPDPNNAAEVALDWASRVVNNGGATPSANSISAAETFYQALIDAGIHTKMKAANMFDPDSLIAATTPLIVGPGSDPWTNANFIAGDLTVNGLKGNGPDGGKTLSTGVRPTNYSALNYGMVVYCSENDSQDGFDLGASNSPYTNGFDLVIQYTNLLGTILITHQPQGGQQQVLVLDLLGISEDSEPQITIAGCSLQIQDHLTLKLGQPT